MVVPPIAQDGDLKMDAWSYVTQWMRLNGAEVNPHLAGNATFHGGNTIRGVVSTAGLVKDEVLAAVPRKLWIETAHFPAIDKADINALDACGSHMSVGTRDRIKLAAAIAVEEKKGAVSFFYPYLSTLPTLADFRTFHPGFAGDVLMKDFGSLPTVSFAVRQQARDREVFWCFDSWKHSPESPAAHVDWLDFELALFQVRTRAYHVGEKPALIPGTDLLNTASDTALNTDWQANDDFFFLSAPSPVAAHVEVYESYCRDCSNSALLDLWGVYEEDNVYGVHEGDVDCDAWTSGHRRSLRDVVEDTVNTTESGLAFARTHVLTAPRCRSGAPNSQEQGPLRCSLSRLAFEYCAQAWGYNKNSMSATSSKSDLKTRSVPTLAPFNTTSSKAEPLAQRNASSHRKPDLPNHPVIEADMLRHRLRASPQAPLQPNPHARPMKRNSFLSTSANE